MKALDSMRSKLKAIRIYALPGNSTVDWELQAYASGLDLAYDALEKLENESFVATACDYGLLNRENQFEISGQGTMEERRAVILKLGAITPNDFTIAAMERALNVAGLNSEICENFAKKKLYVNCLGELRDEATQKAALKVANIFLPAHLNAELDFRSISWNNIDQKEDTFDIRDGLDFSWDSVDHYENAMLEI
jgi:hypothetical protein